MEHRKGKHILYSICFICFALIDWCRGSQNWVTWATMINLTGAILAIIMLSHFQWKKEPIKPYLIWLFFWATGSVIGENIRYVTPWTIFRSQYWTAAASVCLVGIVAIRVYRERKQPQIRNMRISYLQLIFTVMSVFMTISPLGDIWPLGYLVLFSLFYLIPFSDEEQEELWSGMADGQITVFFVLQILAYGFRPYDTLRYAGIYENCNMNALFYMVTYVAILYRAHVLRWHERMDGISLTWKRRIGKLFLWVLAAGMWGFVMLTMTRTALAMLVVITVLYGVVEFIILFRERMPGIFLRGVALVLGVFILFPMVYLTVRWLPTILHHPIWFGAEYNVDKVHSFDSFDSEKYVSWDEVIEGMLGRMGVKLLHSSLKPEVMDVDLPMLASTQVTSEMMQYEENAVWQGKLLEGADAGNSAKLRFRIWELYLKNMNLTGHELEEGYFQITSGYHAWHAQNVFIQFAFYYGCIAGVLFIILTVCIGIRAVKLIFDKGRCEDILPLLIGALFLGYGMLECVWYPGQMILLLVYMIPKIMIAHRRDEQKHDTNIV